MSTPRPLGRCALTLLGVTMSAVAVAQPPSAPAWSSGGQCQAFAGLDQLQLATRTTLPPGESEATHKIAEACFWDSHPDKSFRAPFSSPDGLSSKSITIYVCNNCQVPITVGLRDFTNPGVLPACSADWPETTVRPGTSAFQTCVTGTQEGQQTDYVPYAVNAKGERVGLDPEIILEDNGRRLGALFDLRELGLSVGQRVAVIGRARTAYVAALREQGLVVGLPASGAPDAFILIAPTRDDLQFARTGLGDYFTRTTTGGSRPVIWLIDRPDGVAERTARLQGLFAAVVGRERTLRRGYVAIEVAPVP